jgi:tetratricopeptide (TPR) repeat protein
MIVLKQLTALRGNASRPTARIARRGAALGVIACVALGSLSTSAALARAPHALFEQDEFVNFSGNFLAAQQASRNHDIEAAATYYRNALVADPQNPVLIQSAFQLLLADGRIKDALPLAERILARDKNNHLARLTLGIEAFKRGNFERARSHFAQMQPRADANVPATILELTATLLAGWAYEGQNDTDTALKIIDRLKGPDWYDVFKNYHTGLIDEMAGRKADAARRIGDAYKADSTGLRIVDADARNLARQGKKDEALAVLDAFDKQTPDHPLVKALRADIASGIIPQPLIQTAQSGAAELLFGIGAAIGREGGEEIAAVYLQLALWLDPKAELALITLASVQGQLKQYDKAVSLLEQVPPNSRLKPMVDIQISRYYNVLEKFDKAKERLTGLVKANPKDIDAVMALGDVFRAMKDFGEAANVYTQAIDGLPKIGAADWSLFYYRGISYERTKQWSKAEPDFFKAIDLNPREPHVLNYLGYSWIDMGINLDKGLDLIKKAVALAPDDGYIVDSLGWAYYRLGRYEDSARELERAVALKPEDPVINDHLGDAYWRVGRKLEATFQWAHSRDLKPEPDDLARTLDKLKNGIKDDAGPKTAAAPVTPPPPPVDQPKSAPGPQSDTPKPDLPKSVTPTTPPEPLPGTTPKPEIIAPGSQPKAPEPAPAAPTAPTPAQPAPASPAAPAPTDLAPPKPQVPDATQKPAAPIPDVTPDNKPTPQPDATPAKP